MSQVVDLVADTFDSQAQATAAEGKGAVKLDADNTLAGNSDAAIATQKAVKGYVDAHATAGTTNDTTLAADSAVLVPTEHAVKTYADTKLASSAVDTDATMAANSDSRVASQKATKTALATKVTTSATAITGALSTVADAPAKAVLTSIVAYLVGIGATDSTT